MRPTLEVGDLVVVVPIQYSSIHVGDVIVFARPAVGGGCTSEVIVHRVVGITSEGLITQGDNRQTNPAPDEPTGWPPVAAECVKGLVVFSLPFLGRISEAFPPPLNYILVAAIILLIFAVEAFSARKRDEGQTASTAHAPPTPSPPASSWNATESTDSRPWLVGLRVGAREPQRRSKQECAQVSSSARPWAKNCSRGSREGSWSSRMTSRFLRFGHDIAINHSGRSCPSIAT